MKRLFLLTAALVVALVGFAQKVELKTPFSGHAFAAQPQKMMKKNAVRPSNKVLNAVRTTAHKTTTRSVENGTYYYPTGGLYYGYNAQGGGYYNSCYAVPPFTAITCVGSCEEGVWHYADQETGVTGLNYTALYYPRWADYMPTLVNQVDSFNIGMNNYDYMTGQKPNCLYGLMITDSICTLFPCDPQAGEENNGTVHPSTVGFSELLDNGNLFGSGKILANTEDEPDYISYGIRQDFKPLVSPLYVESLSLNGLSYAENALSEQDTLKAIITIMDKDSVFTDIDTLSCTAADFAAFEGLEGKGPYDQQYRQGVLTFTKKEVDDFGSEGTVPFVIPEGVDYSIDIIGFDSPTVDFGAFGISYPEENKTALDALLLVSDGSHRTAYYFPGVALYLGIVGMFDQVVVADNTSFNEVPEGTHMNALRISDDGQTCTTEGQAADGDYNLGTIMLGNAITWFDEYGNENYSIESDDDMSWMTWNIDNENYGNTSSNFYGRNFIWPVCEALPAGTTGRMAKVHVEGKGVRSEDFYILQGDAQMPDAIESVKAAQRNGDTRTFNIKGQRVMDKTKGLVIKGGKKMMVK